MWTKNITCPLFFYSHLNKLFCGIHPKYIPPLEQICVTAYTAVCKKLPSISNVKNKDQKPLYK